LTEGSEHDFKVIRLDSAAHKISLSYRAARKQVERQEIAAFRSSKSSPTATIGDAVLAKKSSPTATIGDAILAKRQAN